MQLCKSSRMLSKRTKYDFLTDSGAEELEFILMYFNKKINLKSCFKLTNLCCVLMIFLNPCEVYAVVDKLN